MRVRSRVCSTLNDDGLGIVHAPSVILATGGLGHLYSATTNPEGSTGDGVALAMWAGLPVCDLEFIQFHPTMLFDGQAGGRRPLITEAVRGEGAVLLDSQGRSVTEGVHPMGDLAPRDVVAAAIDARMTATGRSLRLPRRARHRGLREAVPHGHGGVPGGGHRSDAPGHPGRPGCALQLRRCADGRAWAHRDGRPVRRRRGGAHRYARREPVGLQQPARGPRGRRPGGKGRRGACFGCRGADGAAAGAVDATRAASGGSAAGDVKLRVGGPRRPWPARTGAGSGVGDATKASTRAVISRMSR